MSSGAGHAVFEWPEYDADLTELLRLCALLCLAFVWGQVVHLVFRVPPHVAELFGGFVLGPSLLDIVPHTDALKLAGILGVLMLGLEVGLGAKFDSFRWSRLVQAVIALLCSTTAIFLGALALYLGPSHLPFVEGVAGGVSVCAASSASAIYTSHPWSRAGQDFVASVAVLESSMCLTAFTIIEVLLTDWGWEDVTQPALSALVLGVVSLALRNLLPLIFAALASRAPADDSKAPPPSHWSGGMLLIMVASGIGACALAESIRSSMLLATILTGAAFGNVKSAEEAWKVGTKSVQRLLIGVFFACSVGFVIPREEWKSADSVLGGLVLMAFTVIAKCIVSLMVGGIGLPGPSMPMAIQVCAALAVPSEVNFYVAIMLQSQFVLSPRGMASVLWCLVIMSLLAPPVLLGVAFLFKKSGAAGFEGSQSPKEAKPYAMKSTVHFADGSPERPGASAGSSPIALYQGSPPPVSKPLHPDLMVLRPQPPLPSAPESLDVVARPLPPLPNAPQRQEPPTGLAVPPAANLNSDAYANRAHVSTPSHTATLASPDPYAVKTLPRTLEATPDPRHTWYGEPPRRRSPHNYADGNEAPPQNSSPPRYRETQYRQVSLGSGML